MASLTDTTFAGGRKTVVFTTQVARSQTSNTRTDLTLPAGFVPIGVRVLSPTASNAGTAATISVGSTNSTTGVFVNTLDVKGTSGIGQAIPSTLSVAGTVLPSATPVTVSYAEAGSASTAGGPWTVFIEGFIV